MKTSKAVPSSSAFSPSSRPSSRSLRRCARFLLLVLLGTVLPAHGQIGGGVFLPGGGVTITHGKDARLARNLAAAVRKVQKRFEEERRELPVLEGAGGEKVYPLPAAIALIEATASDLDRQIAKLREPDLDALRAWADLELRRLRREAEAPASNRERTPAAAAQAVEEGARRASLRRPDLATGWRGKPVNRSRPAVARGVMEKSGAPAAGVGPRQAGVPTGLLDRIQDLLIGLVVLAEKKEFRVDVEVTILPKQGDDLVVFPAAFLLPDGKRKRPGIRPNGGRLVGLLRGIYLYKLNRAPFSLAACPRGGSLDWEMCYLNLMHTDPKILCHLEPKASLGYSDCCLAARGTCEP